MKQHRVQPDLHSPPLSSDLSEAQKQTIKKCTHIVQDFRSGNVSKPRASLLLQQTIPHENSDEETFSSTYESYFNMLDNFEQYRNSSLGHIENVRQRLTAPSEVNQEPADEPLVKDDSAGPLKRQHSPSTEDEENEYSKRTRLDFSTLPWNEPKTRALNH